MKKSKTYSEPKKTESLMDFFPQLRTIPNGWDLSEMFNVERSEFNDPNESINSEETESEQ
jgi:hypothetical protein